MERLPPQLDASGRTLAEAEATTDSVDVRLERLVAELARQTALLTAALEFRVRHETRRRDER